MGKIMSSIRGLFTKHKRLIVVGFTETSSTDALTEGENVSVSGQENSDSSLTALNVQLGEGMRISTP
ncbi:hypothetical protein A2801_00010 [Candidatus Woesebacteria bacterium RIFCSPHIGHO2_01_FULL_41_10]|uniref:Uncharacterized protein n=1 Tax=Candidatus Woesebacteria bacterium RIFCSPHIGHO2_01_FULL_41_10 TaxID=1802500 RepID=A0A1F7YR06_9BACT|nr:MAG: hypothetical protein A2801_00010 [Candidatus Woesebacteria bacterium RIFCSPHIGHO2_01_FULL_41_10]